MKIDYFQAKKNKLIVIEGLVCCRVFLGFPCRWQQSSAINRILILTASIGLTLSDMKSRMLFGQT